MGNAHRDETEWGRATQARAAELRADDEAHDNGRCRECLSAHDEPHTVECQEAEDRRHTRELRDLEIIHDFADWFEVRS